MLAVVLAGAEVGFPEIVLRENRWLRFAPGKALMYFVVGTITTVDTTAAWIAVPIGVVGLGMVAIGALYAVGALAEGLFDCCCSDGTWRQRAELRRRQRARDRARERTMRYSGT